MVIAMQPCMASPPEWTWHQHKLLEMLLCVFPPWWPHQWGAIAGHLGGKTAAHVFERYERIVVEVKRVLEEPGVEFPPEWDEEPTAVSGGEAGRSTVDGEGSRRRGKKRGKDRKKPVKWTLDEHQSFLRGLDDGKQGNWKQISNEYVPSKTASQIASHYQKFNIRQQKKQRNESKRKSIHDITDPNMNLDAIC